MINKKSNNAVPLYQELINTIKQSIDNSTLKENEKLPSENELCQLYNLSRTTVRQALKILEKNGFIYKLKGKGSYVSSQKIYQNRSSFSKFYDDMRNLGKIPISKILSLKVKKPAISVMKKMQLEEEQLICEIKWVRFANDEPLIYETISLNYNFVKGIENKKIEKRKLYEILIQDFNIKMTHGNEFFYPCKLDSEQAKYLKLHENDLGMKIKRIVFQGKDVIEYTSSIVRGDRFVYTINF